MAFRSVVLAAVALLVSTGWAVDSARAEPSATFTGGCGLVAYPGTWARGIVTIVSGAVSCTAAMEVVDRYLHDPTLIHSGNTWSAEFHGWHCATPTSAAADEYGYLSSCLHHSGDEIRVLPERVAPQPPTIDCESPTVPAVLPTPIAGEPC